VRLTTPPSGGFFISEEKIMSVDPQNPCALMRVAESATQSAENAAASAGSAETARDEAAVAKGGAENAQAAAEQARDEVLAALEGVVHEAPSDGKIYGRKDKEWEEVQPADGIDSGVPPGAVFFFAMDTPPDGYLKANGSDVSRIAYATLFTAIGTTYGAGDGSTTFTLPDMRGEFPRGFDDGRGVDTGRVLGSPQIDTMRPITGTASYAPTLTYGGMTGAFYSGGPNNSGDVQATTSAGQRLNFNSARIGPNFNGPETRSRNVAFLACIKY